MDQRATRPDASPSLPGASTATASVEGEAPRLSKRALLSASGALLAAATLPAARTAHAQTPRSALVIAAQIDDLVALDPHHSFEVTGSDALKNVYDQLFAIDDTKPTAELEPSF